MHLQEYSLVVLKHHYFVAIASGFRHFSIFLTELNAPSRMYLTSFSDCYATGVGAMDVSATIPWTCAFSTLLASLISLLFRFLEFRG